VLELLLVLTAWLGLLAAGFATQYYLIGPGSRLWKRQERWERDQLDLRAAYYDGQSPDLGSRRLERAARAVGVRIRPR
jgi:hypothetical protein